MGLDRVRRSVHNPVSVWFIKLVCQAGLKCYVVVTLAWTGLEDQQDHPRI